MWPRPPFSNRPVGVKHFQTIRRCSVDVTHGLVLLFGLGTKALPSWDSKTRWSNLLVGLAGRRTAGPSGHTNSPHPPRGTSFHHVGGIRVSPTGFDLALSCCCGFVSGPTEFGAVDDHAQSACPPAPPTAKLSPTSVFLTIMTSAPLIIGLLIRPHSPGNTKITTAVTNRVIK